MRFARLRGEVSTMLTEDSLTITERTFLAARCSEGRRSTRPSRESGRTLHRSDPLRRGALTRQTIRAAATESHSQVKTLKPVVNRAPPDRSRSQNRNARNAVGIFSVCRSNGIRRRRQRDRKPGHATTLPMQAHSNPRLEIANPRVDRVSFQSRCNPPALGTRATWPACPLAHLRKGLTALP